MRGTVVIASAAKQSSFLFARDCRVAALLAMTVATAACSKIEAWQHPEVAACEEFTKAKSKAPATYKRAKITTVDEQIPLSAWDAMNAEIMGELAKESVFRDLNKMNQSSGGVRSILLEYDADNSFGTPLRGVEVCKFLMTSFAQNKFAYAQKPKADNAISDHLMWQLQQDGETEPSCCLDEHQRRAISSTSAKVVKPHA